MKNKILRKVFTVIEVFILICGGVLIPVFAVSAQKNVAVSWSYPVLMYHHILPEEDNRMFQYNGCVLDLADFEMQMEFIYDNGYYTMTSQDVVDFLYNSKMPPEKSVWITFDDGYESNFMFAYDVLKKYGFRATIFVISSHIAKERVPYDPDKLIYICEEDMEKYNDVFDYASHSDKLHYLNNEGQSALQFEEESVIYNDTQTALSNKNINIKNIYSYPYGKFRDEAVEILRESGIKAAVTVESGYMTPFTDPYFIPRFNIYRSIQYNTFKKIFYIGK